jgi:uncharacterized protein (TIGR02145 family)
MKLSLTLFGLVVFYSLMSAQGKFTDPRDGNTYNTVYINGTVWMKENLRYTGITGTFCFDNDKNNLPLYGALYEWQAAIKSCPVGWHLPSGDEYRKLSDNLEEDGSWGKGPSGNFGIQLGGFQNIEGVFSEMDESGYYWTSTEYDNNNSEYFSYIVLFEMKVVDISRKEDVGEISGTEKMNKYSVRCVKD